ncbi:unnamed protein product [Gulo gulo]|uniref:Uncharacterized protein n=1 Tax=Gulo gulo TaxID=48420 RepID=A0A9X9MET0_GULGU|nr:unnamed protein product [Gulo gulo]
MFVAEPEGTTSAAKPASPQEPAQEPQSAASSKEELNPLSKSWSMPDNKLEKSLVAGPHDTAIRGDEPREKQTYCFT